jgi:hypothetical protein
MGRRGSYLCGVCATQCSSSSGPCGECGSDLLLEARGGYVVALAAGTVPCPRALLWFEWLIGGEA